MDKAVWMFEKMKASSFNADLALYNVLIKGLYEVKEPMRTLDLYIEMKGKCIYPDV